MINGFVKGLTDIMSNYKKLFGNIYQINIKYIHTPALEPDWHQYLSFKKSDDGKSIDIGGFLRWCRYCRHFPVEK